MGDAPELRRVFFEKTCATMAFLALITFARSLRSSVPATRWRSGSLLLAKPNTSSTIELPASLRTVEACARSKYAAKDKRRFAADNTEIEKVRPQLDLRNQPAMEGTPLGYVEYAKRRGAHASLVTGQF
jgi:hypothetical protein